MIARLGPLMLLLGGGGVVATGGGTVGERAINTVKTVLTSYELAEASRSLELDIMLGMSRPENSKQLLQWIRSNMRARMGRDAGLDLWETPYEYVPDSKAVFGMRSLGADGAKDSCPGDNPQAA
ncbi:MAG TPA: hypothetical protein DCQ06_01125, partial [Myxococcales bacterium]|nr:hypothetical protein [Myxococcales bacterium]